MSRTYGENWRDARVRAGFRSVDSVVKVLDAMFPDDKGLSRTTIYELEANRSNATMRTMQLLADVYGVKLGQIFALPGERIDDDPTPHEFRPLANVLRDFSADERSSIIRSLASTAAMLIQTKVTHDAGEVEGDNGEEPQAQPA